MKKTNLQIINFINFARTYGKFDKEGKPVANPSKSKFTYALERMEKKASKAHEAFAEKMSDLNIEHAATDKDGTLLTDGNGTFRFTKDGLRARNTAHKALLVAEVEIEPYYATEPPKEALTEVEKEVCAGFVIEENVARDGDDEQQAPE